MKKITMTASAVLTMLIASAAYAGHAYISYDAENNMVISGPFDAVIPKPARARFGPVEHSTEYIQSEELKISKAGYFADDQLVIVQVETTNASAGTLTNENLPVYLIGDREFRARETCIEISQEELDAAFGRFIESIQTAN